MRLKRLLLLGFLPLIVSSPSLAEVQADLSCNLPEEVELERPDEDIVLCGSIDDEDNLKFVTAYWIYSGDEEQQTESLEFFSIIDGPELRQEEVSIYAFGNSVKEDITVCAFNEGFFIPTEKCSEQESDTAAYLIAMLAPMFDFQSVDEWLGWDTDSE